MTNILENIQKTPVIWKNLGEVATIYGGLTGKTKHDFAQGEGKFITYKNVFDHIEIDPTRLESVCIKPDEKQNIVQYGDILFTGSSETAAEVAMSSAVTTKFSEPVYLNSFSFGVRFNEQIAMSPEFCKYLFRSELMRKQIIKTASGVTRFNVSKEKFKKIKIPIPPLELQREIVRVLDLFSEKHAALAAALRFELAARQKQYAFYRDFLLSADNLHGAAWLSLGELVTTVTAPVKLKTKSYALSGKLPIIDQGEKFIAGYTDEDFEPVSQGEYVIFGDHSEHIKYVDFPFVQGADGLKILRSKHALAKYIFYAFKNFYQKEQSYKRHWAKAKQTQIPIPSLDQQAKIVDILDRFEMLANSLAKGLPREIELRKKQYEYYREQLLNFAPA